MADLDNTLIFVLSERKCTDCDSLLWVRLTNVGLPSKAKKRCTVCTKRKNRILRDEWRKTHREKPWNWENICPETRARRTHTCQQCGTQYLNKRGGGEGKKYCSRGCAFAGHKAWMSNGHEPAPLYTALPKYSQVQHKHCVVCGSGFYGRTGGRNAVSYTHLTLPTILLV